MTISIRLHPEIETRLKKLSKETGRSITFYVGKALETYMNDREDYEIAVARLEDPKVRYIPHEEVKSSMEIGSIVNTIEPI